VEYRVKASRGKNREGRIQWRDAADRLGVFRAAVFALGDFFATAAFFDFDREIVEEFDVFFFFTARRGECFRRVRAAGDDTLVRCADGASSRLTIAAALSANSCVVATTLPAA
jgi:hypothetical protein